VGDRNALLVKRFDRIPREDGSARARMLSALKLLRAEDTHRDRWSYVLLAKELRRISARPAEEARELFKRMVFNALITNTDDHPRNHAVIAPEHEWRLSPAYDLIPFPAVSEERRDLALTIRDYGRYANATNALSQCSAFRSWLIFSSRASVSRLFRPARPFARNTSRQADSVAAFTLNSRDSVSRSSPFSRRSTASIFFFEDQPNYLRRACSETAGRRTLRLIPR
jgi:hypothetical protein